MTDIESLRESTQDISQVMMGVQLADMAFFEAVVDVLKRIDPNAPNTIKQVMAARITALTHGHEERTQQVARTRVDVVSEIISR